MRSGVIARIRLQLVILVIVKPRRIIIMLLLLLLLAVRRRVSGIRAPGFLLKRLRRAGPSWPAYPGQFVSMLAVHPQEMFLHMVRAIERFVTDVTVEWFLLAMDVLVPRVQIATIGSVGTVRTGVTFPAR